MKCINYCVFCDFKVTDFFANFAFVQYKYVEVR